MVDSHRAENFYPYNERSFQTLARALALSSKEFELILVRCNYISWRRQILERLRQEYEVSFCDLILPDSVTQLHATIQAKIGIKTPPALMVLGLESVIALDDLLVSINRMRDQFYQNFSFPLVLWVTDIVLQKLTRLAPDFKSCAAPAIKFEIPTQELIEFVRRETDLLFARVLQTGAIAGWDQDILSCSSPISRQELAHAYRELESRDISLDPALIASWQFLQAREAFIDDDWERSRLLYEQSLAFWQAASPGFSTGEKLAINLPSLYLERQGCLLFNLGIWWLKYGICHQFQYGKSICQARVYFEECVDIFERLGRRDLVAKFINALGEVLKRLKDWRELKMVATTARDLHQVYANSVNLAHSYGLLAEVALVKLAWHSARRYAEMALEIILNNENSSGLNIGESDLQLARKYHSSWYLLLLSKSDYFLGRIRQAIANLERAKIECYHQYTPQLYIEILKKLRSVYFEQGQYLEALQLKLEQAAIEHLYGLRAFIGSGCLQGQRKPLHAAKKTFGQVVNVAPEIAITERQKDIDCLLERLSRNDNKLTVIYGKAAVGKSSLIKGGLVPQLRHRLMRSRITLPVVLSDYTNWIEELGQLLTQALQELEIIRVNIPHLSHPLNSLETIADQLENNSDSHLLTVLIFDQFEQFFYVCPHTLEQQRFYEFIRLCLNLPFVKIILSIREDYLHYLLECDRLVNFDMLNNNVLDKNILYYLQKLTIPDVTLQLQNLSDTSRLPLETALIEELVLDLADDAGTIDPLELQLVGWQLETNRITTLEQYQKIGRKENLLKQFVETTIKYCGSENEHIACILLYFLTDQNRQRPLKTGNELFRELTAIGCEVESEIIDFSLTMLVAAKLVIFVPEFPKERYQLAGDYLVNLVQEEAQKLIQKIANTAEQKSREQEQLTIVLTQRLKEAKQTVLKLTILTFVAMLFAVSAIVLWWRAENQKQEGIRNYAIVQLS